MDPGFDPVQYAHQELVPLLDALCQLAAVETAEDQERFFSAILRGVESASDATDLAEPFMELSMSAFVGFQFSPPVAMILDSLLEKAQHLTEALSLDAEEVH